MTGLYVCVRVGGYGTFTWLGGGGGVRGIDMV